MNILITGTAGYVGNELVQKLTSPEMKQKLGIDKVVGLDIAKPKKPVSGAIYKCMDIRDKLLDVVFKDNAITHVIHLACVISPSKRVNVELMESINIDGTKNIIECCKNNNVQRISFASSGAAYGYYEESVYWLTEDNPIRGNKEFPYSYHKRVNEEDFDKLQKTNPKIEQFIFRIGTVLGKNVNNPITDLFKKPFILGIQGASTPFVFIWDEDLVNIFIKSLTSKAPGKYNVAGDGAVDMKDIAHKLNKKLLSIPSKAIEGGLGLLKRLGLTQYGPEQVKFLKYRPVLLNVKLKNKFGYIPNMNSYEVFDYYLKNRKYS